MVVKKKSMATKPHLQIKMQVKHKVKAAKCVIKYVFVFRSEATPTCLLNDLDNGHDPCDRSHGSDPGDRSLSGTCRSLPFALLLASTDHLSCKEEHALFSQDNDF